MEPGDRCLHLGPISHGSGYLFVPIWVWGGCNIMLDRSEASAAVEIMERERIGYLFAVPTMVNAIKSRADRARARLVEAQMHADSRGADFGGDRIDGT